MKKYLDFDLLIEPNGEGYTARVFNSPGGQASSDFAAPFSDLELENFLLRVGRTRHTVRRVESPEMANAKAFGGRLFNGVFAGDVRGCLRSSIDEAGRQGAGLRVRLHLSKVPALADLPWEFLYNSGMNRFLSLSVETPLVRFLELPERIRPVTVTPPLKVLMMISSPSDYPKLDVERESAKINEALSDLERRGLVTVERQENATLAELQRRLRQSEYHIFHFVGHGGFDEQAQDGLLILEDQEERGRRVSAQFLGTLLHDHRPLRLAVLNACEGARASRSDPFAGTAQSLVQQGIPAVIAMQFEVTDEAAICFTREFYSSLAAGYPVDAALAESRKAIFAEVSEIEWGTPVLYMRAPDGRIFDIEKVSDDERTRLRLTALLTAARDAQEAGDLATARQRVQEVLALDSQHADALTRLQAIERAAQESSHRQQADALASDAAAAMAAGRWDQAIERWQALTALDPEHRQARGQLIEARRQKDLADRYAHAKGHFDGRRWREAHQELQQIQHMAGSYKDVAALLSAAERELHKPPPGPPPDHGTRGRDVKPEPKRAKWMFVGGTLGVAAMVALVVVIGIVAVVIEQSSSQAPVNQFVDADPADGDLEPLDDVTPEPPAPPAPPAAATVTPALRQALTDAIQHANAAETEAFSTLNPARLYEIYTGPELQSHLSTIGQLQAQNTFMVSTLNTQRFDDFALSPDGQAAQVRSVENWSSNFFSRFQPTVCAYHWHNRDIPQTVHLQLLNGRWMVAAIDQSGAPPPQQDRCH